MNLTFITRQIAVALIALSLTSCAKAEMTIAYITNGNTNEGWTLINGGAKEAGKKAGVKFIELAAEKGELSKQLAIVEDMITRKVDAIAIAPVDSAGIAPAVNRALAAGIPVIAVDTGITGAKITSYVATDNIKAANVQGDWAATQLKDGDKIIYITGDQGQSTGQERKKGFVDALKAKLPNVKVIEVSTTWDQTQAQNGVEAAIRANSDIKLIACAWDGGALGAVAAMKGAGIKAGDIKLAGFDGSPGGLDMMKQGWQQANAAQMLAKIGQVGVETAVAAAKKQKVEARIDTGAFLVLPSNVDKFAKDSGVAQFMKEK